MLAPTIGGLIVRLISYQAAFIAAMVIAAIALIYSRGIHDPRAEAASQSQ